GAEALARVGVEEQLDAGLVLTAVRGELVVGGLEEEVARVEDDHALAVDRARLVDEGGEARDAAEGLGRTAAWGDVALDGGGGEEDDVGRRREAGDRRRRGRRRGRRGSRDGLG